MLNYYEISPESFTKEKVIVMVKFLNERDIKVHRHFNQDRRNILENILVKCLLVFPFKLRDIDDPLKKIIKTSHSSTLSKFKILVEGKRMSQSHKEMLFKIRGKHWKVYIDEILLLMKGINIIDLR